MVKNNLLILGNFDGVHLGHQNLILKAVEYSKKNNLKSIVYTFKTLSKDKKYIISLEKRRKILMSLGVDEVYFAEFDEVKKLSPKDFVLKILIDKFNAKVAFCGYNYMFGYMKEGNTNTLNSLIETHVVDEFRLDGELVSSTKIRELITNGNVEKVNKLSGYTYSYDGVVEKGRQLGRLIGFPTANISLKDNRIKLANGVYGSYTKIEGYNKEFLSITNVGNNPTIAENNNISIETHIIDFNEDIYGKKITVNLLKMIRKEIKFNTVMELKKQINNDVEKWRNYVKY